MSDLELFNKKRNNNNIKFEESKNKSIYEKINILNSIIKEDNTDEKYLIEFLKLKKEKQDIDLEDYLKIYEDGITKTKFYQNFGITKKSAYEKLIEVFTILCNINSKTNQEEIILEIKKILDIKNPKYNQTFPITYIINKELYFNSLVYILIKQIKKDILKPNSNIEENQLTDLIDLYIIKKEETQKIKLINSESVKGGLNIMKNDIIKNLDFYYIKTLSKFIEDLYLKFQTRFKKSEIFINEYYIKNEEGDIGLFRDFIYFLKNFRFIIDDIITETKIWRETFEPTVLEGQKYHSKEDALTITRKDNSLIITQQVGQLVIPNIDEYTNPLMPEIKKGINYLDVFELTKYLKKDKYDSNIFIKKHWNILSDYIADILCSPTIKSAYIKLFKSESQFLTKRDIKKILNNMRFFSFNTDAVAETKKRFLSIYMEATIKIFEKNINIKKIVYLSVFLITSIHEIIGHLCLRILNYLNPHGKKIFSPQANTLKSPYSIERGKESGEFLEEQLFGNYGFQMTMKQILFILDKINYNQINHETFRNNFKAINNNSVPKISNDLKNILRLYDIDLNEITSLRSSRYFEVSKSKIKNIYKFPQQHNTSKFK